MTPNTTETKIGGKLYLVTGGCSPNATETVEKKLERLICRHTSDTKSYQSDEPETLAMCQIVCEYTTDTTEKE